MFTSVRDHYKSKLSYVKRSVGLWLYVLRLVHNTSVYVPEGGESWLTVEENEKIPSVQLWNKPWISGEEVIRKFLTSFQIYRWAFVFLPGEIISATAILYHNCRQ